MGDNVISIDLNKKFKLLNGSYVTYSISIPKENNQFETISGDLTYKDVLSIVLDIKEKIVKDIEYLRNYAKLYVRLRECLELNQEYLEYVGLSEKEKKKRNEILPPVFSLYTYEELGILIELVYNSTIFNNDHRLDNIVRSLFILDLYS